MNRRVMLFSEVKDKESGAEAKASLNRAKVKWHRPETEWSSYGQVEVYVKVNGGPNEGAFKRSSMNCD